MKGTESFNRIIIQHLEGVAKADPLFAETYKKTNKNITDCVTYILNTVKSTGACGFDDAEIFQMAIHYYDEDDIKVGTPIKAKVVVNHTISAVDNNQSPATKKKNTAKKEIVNQPSLF